jgi:hypothetical protein
MRVKESFSPCNATLVRSHLSAYRALCHRVRELPECTWAVSDFDSIGRVRFGALRACAFRAVFKKPILRKFDIALLVLVCRVADAVLLTRAPEAMEWDPKSFFGFGVIFSRHCSVRTVIVES